MFELSALIPLYNVPHLNHGTLFVEKDTWFYTFWCHKLLYTQGCNTFMKSNNLSSSNMFSISNIRSKQILIYAWILPIFLRAKKLIPCNIGLVPWPQGCFHINPIFNILHVVLWYQVLCLIYCRINNHLGFLWNSIHFFQLLYIVPT